MDLDWLVNLILDYLPGFFAPRTQRILNSPCIPLDQDIPLGSQHFPTTALLPDDIKRLSLSGPDAQSLCDPYELGRAVISLQLEIAARRDSALIDTSPMPYFLDIDLIRTIVPSKSVQENVKILLQIATENGMNSADVRKLWGWTALPYTTRNAGLARDAGVQGKELGTGRLHGLAGCVNDQDIWLLENEARLRLISRRAALCQDTAPVPWSYGLIPLHELPVALTQPFNVLESNGSTVALRICRPASLPGFCVLGRKVKSNLYVQPSLEAFEASWASMSGEVLKGLDWDNVFVAGGLVLGTLLTPQGVMENGDVHAPDEWQASDIDLYIYGLPLDEANKKLEEIARTVTLYSSWPTRRVQIVLKLMKAPGDILLNFDLDPCAIGYDGAEVWMLPRFVRALETGYTNFTMDMVNGHYLGDRKSSRDTRIFKYAAKGFGLRFLPQYLDYLPSHLSVDRLASQADKWTQRCIHNRILVDIKVPIQVRGWPPAIGGTLPRIAHSDLDHYMQHSPGSGQSCLNGFSLLMRHVALWEEEAKGNVLIKERVYAENSYGEAVAFADLMYDDTPRYRWDQKFDMVDFCKEIRSFNQEETKIISQSLRHYQADLKLDKAKNSVRRLTYGTDIDDIFSRVHDLEVILVLSEDFVSFSNSILEQAMTDVGHPSTFPPLTIISKSRITQECLVSWKLDYALNWQMLDRRIDELREVLWIYHNTFQHAVFSHRAQQMISHAFRRSTRETEEEEGEAFAEWVARKPYHVGPGNHVYNL
ncbi:hypothetical protein CYLTODRAFT_495250 [Cylindrobasidium torrendii FP15055 ss-10]|uniref:Uncharacterized protein n=1 Tax=Cylindrobasidium torrendii FP15055 ss-10 TaxID=1314674 RepID=A0A0D7AVZ7_9AGAR|nr:hypothetical protein CYLTODRAFT_495250 [Cylindrobasidium torrendii FP15055 ss-10]